MKSFNILALNANYEIISIVSYTTLQWSRKFHEPGTFCFSVPLGQYTKDWKYIYTPERPEVGEITQVNYVSQDGFAQMYISGFFLENQLNRMVVYPYTRYMYDPQDPGGNLQTYPNAILWGTQPTWAKQKGYASNVAMAYFNAFKSISFNAYTATDSTQRKTSTFALDILPGTIESGTYKRTEDTRNGEQLGDKLYSILKPSGASYKVRFDFEHSTKYIDIVIGKDKTEDTTTENPIIFSTKYGNITNPNVVISNNDYKDGVIQHLKATTKEIYKVYQQPEPPHIEVVSVVPTVKENAEGHFVFLDGKQTLNDYQATLGWDEFMLAVAGDAREELEKLGQVVNVDFDALDGSYEYLVDFDIGDLVSIEIPEIDFSADARLIGCYETIQEGKWNLALEFGTPIIKR